MDCVGLTGGIGSGKSTVAALLAQLGAEVIDADALSRASTQAGGAAMSAIQQTFGTGVLAADGGLDRAAMRELMLRDGNAKTKLEAIIHPIVGAQMALQRQAAESADVKLVVMDIPLLVEGAARWRPQLDAVWVIDCLPATQISRVMQRSAWPKAQIESIMAAQASRAQRLACADAVIFNEGVDLIQLQQLVSSFVQRLSVPRGL
jgi:dephospho-CoA kinase